MKIYFLFIFLMYNLFTYSQIDSLSYYYEKGELNKAIKYSEKFKLDKSNSNYVELITWKAELNYELGRLEEAIKYYKLIEDNLDLSLIHI